MSRARLETLEAQLSESQEQLGRELEKSKSLEEEREQLEEKLCWLSEQSGRREVSRPMLSVIGEPLSPATTLYRRVNKDAVSPADAAQDWLSQQRSGSVRSPSASPAACGPWRTADKILSKLYLISSKLSSMASRPGSRLIKDPDKSEFIISGAHASTYRLPHSSLVAVPLPRWSRKTWPGCSPTLMMSSPCCSSLPVCPPCPRSVRSSPPRNRFQFVSLKPGAESLC